ncbi:MAG: orotidine-5'-phosphate decarboxylase [Planctomycetaceae bacterium]|jgi:orotidine-5'-phosphate decarboxylase|nr:orotidine-5'-phosphate decarboxylase [Planctomycetaceae bacterium]
MPSFSEKLEDAVRAKKTPALIGLDPRYDMLPDELKRSGCSCCGESRHHEDYLNPETIATAFGQFCYRIIDVVAPFVSAVKPQMAFFEQYGSMGLFVLENIVQYAQQKGLLVILDGKRNDIGSTAAAYADGLIGAKSSIWGGDALTVNPYLGDDSLEPFEQIAKERDAGIFVLVKTSNKGGAMLQDIIADGKPVYQHVAEYVESRNVSDASANGYGNIGAVVGATWAEQLTELRAIMPHTWFLVPGYGSQGGSAKDVAGAFDANGLGALVNNSRGIIFAYKTGEFVGKFDRWEDAVLAATQAMIARLAADTSAGKL